MGRRSDDDEGMVAEILDAALDQPLAGFVAFVLSAALAGVIHVVKPATMPEQLLWTVFELAAGGLAIVGLLGGAIGLIRCLVTGRDFIGRPGRNGSRDELNVSTPKHRPPPAQRPSTANTSSANRSPANALPANPPTQPASPPASAIPACPRCHRPMQIRTARRGPRAGQRFWGCTDYPRCTEIVDIVEVE